MEASPRPHKRDPSCRSRARPDCRVGGALWKNAAVEFRGSNMRRWIEWELRVGGGAGSPLGGRNGLPRCDRGSPVSLLADPAWMACQILWSRILEPDIFKEVRRWTVLARLGGKIVSSVWTYRIQDECRVVSMRA
eukprot:1383674-Amorphochlora_amoeboformis.AAC.2